MDDLWVLVSSNHPDVFRLKLWRELEGFQNGRKRDEIVIVWKLEWGSGWIIKRNSNNGHACSAVTCTHRRNLHFCFLLYHILPFHLVMFHVVIVVVVPDQWENFLFIIVAFVLRMNRNEWTCEPKLNSPLPSSL